MMTAMTPVRELETRALTLADQAKALKITDQPSYNLAVERLLGVAALRREIVAHHEPMKKAAHQAWQQVITGEKKLLDPVELAEQTYKTAIAAYEAEQRRIEAQARAKAEAEARRAAEEALERQLQEAEGQGADAEEVAAMIAAPLVVAPPRVEPTFQQAKGVSIATNWRGEVVSLEKLVQAIAAGQASIGLVMPNQTSINALAKATRNTLAIPGIRFFSEPVVRAGRK
jgi:hypothetical protein